MKLISTTKDISTVFLYVCYHFVRSRETFLPRKETITTKAILQAWKYHRFV